MYNDVRFTLNGKPMVYTGNPLRRLLDVLREDYGLTGSKEGCGEGECGACSIIKNGKLVTPCIIPEGQVHHRGICRGRRCAVRLLHPGHGDGHLCAAQREP